VSKHRPAEPTLPFRVVSGGGAAACARCGKAIDGRYVQHGDDPLCLRCARRALLSWADERRAEAAAARGLAAQLASRSREADAPLMRAA
jgi:hypothetical protein